MSKKKGGKAKSSKKNVSPLKILAATVGTLAVLGGSYFAATNTNLLTQKCHARGTTPNTLPDTKCTPGSIDPHITQANIHQTICVSGYSATVRPPTSYTNKLKTQQIQEYGYTDKKLGDYEEDHLISLELGGNPTDPKNLWPEAGNSPNPKDTVENRCKKKVCADEIPLATAQKQIRTNWLTACQ